MASKIIEETVGIIIEASVRLKCTIETRTRALLIYHHFKRCVHEVEYDPNLVAAACLSLSIKHSEEPVEYSSIIHAFFSIIDISNPRITCDDKFRTACKSVGMMEILILRMIEFSVNYILPFDYLKCLAFNLREPLGASNLWDSFVEISTKISSDFYLTDKCLNYKPEQVAISAVKTSLYMLGVNINTDDCYLQNWVKLLDGVDESTKYSLTDDMYEMYSQLEKDNQKQE